MDSRNRKVTDKDWASSEGTWVMNMRWGEPV